MKIRYVPYTHSNGNPILEAEPGEYLTDEILYIHNGKLYKYKMVDKV